MDSVTPKIHELVNLLKDIKPGFLPRPLFVEVARIIALPILEVVPIRLRNGSAEVLFLKRAIDDAFWPSAMHTPGTVIRATDIIDGSIESAFSRIINDELAGTQVTAPSFVCLDARTSLRGAEQAQVYWVEVLGEPKAGVFFPVGSLPTLVETQAKFIDKAVYEFLEHKRAREGLGDE